MNLRKASNLLFTTCCGVQKENKAETEVIFEKNSEVNYTFLKKTLILIAYQVMKMMTIKKIKLIALQKKELNLYRLI